MLIAIDDDVKTAFKYDFEKNIKILLKDIPVEHLNSLSKITVSYESNRDAVGSYFPKSQTIRQPYIAIYANQVVNSYPRVIVFLFPGIITLALSKVLFHEIGHHYQHNKLGYKKHVWEKSADKYAIEMQRRWFASTRLGKLIQAIKGKK